MNDNLGSQKDSYSKGESRFLFASKDKEGTQISNDGLDEFTMKVEKRSEKNFFLSNNIEKQFSKKKTHEYDIVDYLIFYLILFSSIGISTIIIMGAT